MKLFLVMSDSHGDIGCIKKIMGEYPAIQSIIHLGDYFKDAVILKEYFPEKEYFMVPGNCDSFNSGTSSETVLEVEGLRILLTHGNRYGVKTGLESLRSKATAGNIDVVLYGHTHIPLITKTRDCLIVNPGSAGYPRYDGPSTYALLEIGGGRAEARIMEVL